MVIHENGGQTRRKKRKSPKHRMNRYLSQTIETSPSNKHLHLPSKPVPHRSRATLGSQHTHRLPKISSVQCATLEKQKSVSSFLEQNTLNRNASNETGIKCSEVTIGDASTMIKSLKPSNVESLDNEKFKSLRLMMLAQSPNTRQIIIEKLEGKRFKDLRSQTKITSIQHQGEKLNARCQSLIA